jgi:hypothetical protein
VFNGKNSRSQREKVILSCPESRENPKMRANMVMSQVVTFINEIEQFIEGI